MRLIGRGAKMVAKLREPFVLKPVEISRRAMIRIDGEALLRSTPLIDRDGFE
jgi:hypothetical protein